MGKNKIKELKKIIENDLILLISDIEYGDISDLDTNLNSISSSLVKVLSELNISYNPDHDSLAAILSYFSNIHDTSDLESICQEFENISIVGSDRSYDIHAITELKVSIELFESKFYELLEAL